MSRTVELIVGVIGSVIGIVTGYTLVIHGEDFTDYIQTFTPFQGVVGDRIVTLGLITMVASLLTLLFSLLIKKNPLVFGIFLVLVGMMMFTIIGQAWILAGILLLIAGFMGIFRVTPS